MTYPYYYNRINRTTNNGENYDGKMFSNNQTGFPDNKYQISSENSNNMVRIYLGYFQWEK